MREYTKAMEACQEVYSPQIKFWRSKTYALRSQASIADTEAKHTREIEAQIQKVSTALYAERQGESEEETLQRAMRDPEVAVR